MRDIENAVYDFQNKNSAHFVPWVSVFPKIEEMKSDGRSPTRPLRPYVPYLLLAVVLRLPSLPIPLLSAVCPLFTHRETTDNRRGLPAIARAVPETVPKKGIHSLVHWRGNVSWRANPDVKQS